MPGFTLDVTREKTDFSLITVFPAEPVTAFSSGYKSLADLAANAVVQEDIPVIICISISSYKVGSH